MLVLLSSRSATLLSWRRPKGLKRHCCREARARQHTVMLLLLLLLQCQWRALQQVGEAMQSVCTSRMMAMVMPPRHQLQQWQQQQWQEAHQR